jgi:fructokinase
MILCCGEALIDFLPRESAGGDAVFQPFNGGSVYNSAIALGRLDVPVGLFAGLSQDFFGDSLRAGLAESQVSLKYCRTKPNHTTLAFVKLVDGHARYSFVDDASAARMLTKADLPKLPKSVTALHFGSISLIPEPCGGTYEALLKRERKSRVISIDPNIRASLIKDRKSHLVRLNRLMALSDIVKISDEDVKWMTGKADLKAFARKQLKAGAQLVAVTKGGDGVELFAGKLHVVLMAPKVKVADTVGAGDTFTAGFLTYLHRHGLLTKKAIGGLAENELAAAATFAMEAAAVTVSRPGANPPWTREMA